MTASSVLTANNRRHDHRGSPCVVTQVKTKETDGYTSLQLAFETRKTSTLLPHKRITSPNRHFSKQFVKEFRDYS